MSCHACHLMWWSCHLMRCDCLCCVMSRDAMQCHAMCAHVKSCHLLCPAMGWNVTSLRCHYSLKYYSVLQSTAPVLLCTTKYDPCTTPSPVLLRTTPVLLCTTKYSCTSHAPTSPNAAPATKSQCHDPSS